MPPIFAVARFPASLVSCVPRSLARLNYLKWCTPNAPVTVGKRHNMVNVEIF